MRPRHLLLATHVGASGSGGGMIRYTVEYARTLHERGDVELHVLASPDGSAFFGPLLGPDRVHTVPSLPTAARSLVERWWPVGDWDVVHGTKHLLPRWCGRALRVLTVHDTVLFERPQDFGLLKRTLLAGPYRASIQEADVLVCVSEATRAAVARWVPRTGDRAVGVPLAMSRALLDTPSGADLVPGDVPFALVVGDASARKNLALPVGMWHEVHRRVPGATLVVVGPPDWLHAHHGEEWDALVTGGAVRPLGHVPDESLRRLYERASVVLCPSLLEGFGLPALEARTFGAPVLTSTDPALQEASGGGPAIPVDDVDGWIGATAAALTVDRREPAAVTGFRTWDDVVDETLAAIHAARPAAPAR